MAHAVRGPADVEGWAQLCPACIGRAGENGFLRFRLRQALAERAAAQRGAAQRGAAQRGAGVPSVPTGPAALPAAIRAENWADGSGPTGPPLASPDEIDDRYLRRGRFARGPIHDAAWHAELDAAGRWLDALPFQGEIVELAAGTGWWSALLAGKGSLSIYDEGPARLDRARERLVAHRLRAHLHVRGRWEPPDRPVDALFIGPELADVPTAQLDAFLALAHDWLRPGGLLAAIDLLADSYAGAVDESPRPGRDPEILRAGLLAAGFGAVDIATGGRFFALMSGRA